MKTRKQKVICKVFSIVVSILLLASFFVVPVSAADVLSNVVVSNIMYEYGGDDNDPDQRPFSSLYLYENSADFKLSSFNSIISTNPDFLNPLYIDSYYNQYMEFTYPNVNPNDFYIGFYYINQLFDDGVTRIFARGDTLFLEGGFFGCWTFDDARLTQVRFTLRDLGNPYDFSFGKAVAFTEVVDINVDEDSEGFDYDRLAFNFTQDITSSSLCLCAEFKVAIPDEEFMVGFELTDFTIRFGSGVSPNYPIYPQAPGGDDVGSLGSAEQELINSQQQGIDEGLSSIENAGNVLSDLDTTLKLGAFSTTLISIMSRINEIPGIDAIIQISLSLGLLASFLSMGAAIISAADRRAGQAKREAQRESQRGSQRGSRKK